MHPSLLLIVALVGSSCALTELEIKVVDAIRKAQINVDKTNDAAPTIAENGINLQSQKASPESQLEQVRGDLLMEVTKILVAENGRSLLPQLEKVDVQSLIAVVDTQSRLGARVRGGNKDREDRPDRQGRGKGKDRNQSQATTGRPGSKPGNCPRESTDCSIDAYSKYRAITAVCNNKGSSQQGANVSPMRRLTGSSYYADGIGSVRSLSTTGSVLPSAREVSNKLHAEGRSVAFDYTTNHLHMQMGQYIAHDLIFMPSSVGTNGESLDCSLCTSSNITHNCAPITVPDGDTYFPAKSCIRLTRALNAQQGLGQRQQINQNTHYLDLSVVYGSEECEAAETRLFSGGELKTFDNGGYVLPPQAKKDPNCQSKSPFFCFSAGDFRNSLHPGLIPLHTAFIKEHNRIAREMKSLRPEWKDDQLFQEARRVMIAQYQHFVYREYLPKLLGDSIMKEFDLYPKTSGFFLGYSPAIPAVLTNEFAACAYRFGHSQVRKDIPRKSNTNATRGASADLGSNTFYTEIVYRGKEGGTESMLEGMCQMPAMKIDQQFTFPIRNQLFEIRGNPGSGVDLVSVNIMRGRDVGLFPYNEYRARVGLKKATSFDDLRREIDSANVEALRKVYASVDDIDLYPGLLMERHLAGGMIGRTGAFIIAETFKNLKMGDRFYYENQVAGTRGLTIDELNSIRTTSLARLLCESSSIMDVVNQDIFDLNSKRVPCEQIKEANIELFVR